MIKTENVLCIFRNFTVLGTRAKIFVLLCGAIILSVNLVSTYEKISYILSVSQWDNLILKYYMIFTNLLATVILAVNVFTGIKQSEQFKIIVSITDNLHESCKNRSVYPRALSRVTTRTMFFFIYIFLTSISVSIFCIVNNADVNVATIHIIVESFLYAWREIYFILELLTFHVLVSIVALALKEINTSIIKSMNDFDQIDDIPDLQNKCSKLQNLIEEFAVIFISLSTSIRCLLQCFGLLVGKVVKQLLC